MKRSQIASSRTRPGGSAQGPEAGYSMVVLMVAVTILTVFTAAALPHWTQAMKREKEAELIFRGWQYAEAIRVFQQRHGRYPTRVQELLEIKPRSIRKLWKDPMTDDGEWGLVFQGEVAPPRPGQGGEPPDAGGGRPDGTRGGSGAGPAARQPGQRGEPGVPRPGEERTVGPIVGVRSLSEEESIRTFFGEERYDAWLFTVDKLTRTVTGGGQVGFGGGRSNPRPILPRVEWLGKPFPDGLVPQQGQGPGGQRIGPGGRPEGTGDQIRDGGPPGSGGRPSRRP